MPPEIEGYKFLGEVKLDELCDFVFADENPVDQWINNNWTDDASAFDALCFGVSVVDSFLTSPIGGAISFLVCEAVGVTGRVAVCGAQDLIEQTTSCNDIVVKVYIAKDQNPKKNLYPGYLIIDCDNDVLQTTVQDLADAADNYESEAIKAGENLVDETVEVGENIVDGAQDFIGSYT